MFLQYKTSSTEGQAFTKLSYKTAAGILAHTELLRQSLAQGTVSLPGVCFLEHSDQVDRNDTSLGR